MIGTQTFRKNKNGGVVPNIGTPAPYNSYRLSGNDMTASFVVGQKPVRFAHPKHQAGHVIF